MDLNSACSFKPGVAAIRRSRIIHAFNRLNRFPELDRDVLIQLLTGVAASQGSSCSAGSFELSHVLRAIGVTDSLARASLRLGVGRFNMAEDMEAAANLIGAAVGRARMAAKS